MFQFGGFPSCNYGFITGSTVLHRMCFHIQKSADRGLFAAPRSLSQLVTSFFGSWCQGILLVLLFAWTSFVVYLYTVRICSLFQELLSTLKQFFRFVLLYLAISTITCAAGNCNFFTLNLNLNLERPIWFQILSFSLLTLSLTCLFFVFSLN